MMHETSNMAAFYTLLLFSLNYALCFAYPYYGDGRTLPLVTARRQLPYYSKQQTARVSEYPLFDTYDDAYVPKEVDFDYYDKYDPYAQFGRGSYTPFYRPMDYLREKFPRKNWEKMGYYDYPATQDVIDEFEGMYGDDSWYDDVANSEANRAFITNLILAQMYEDEKNSAPYRYDTGDEDYNGRKYEYGIPTTSIGEKEKVRRYFQEKANQDVQELKALVRKQGKGDEINELKTTEKPNIVNEMTDAPAKTKPKLNDAANFFNLQKQMILNSRKTNDGQVAEGLKLPKKRMADPINYFDLESSDESTTNSIKKSTTIKEEDMPSTSTTVAEPSTTASPQNLAKDGQKEVVLPRPSKPRKPYNIIVDGPLNRPVVYDTNGNFKRNLNPVHEEKEDHPKFNGDKAKAQPEKRSATDDPLTAELNDLKKKSA